MEDLQRKNTCNICGGTYEYVHGKWRCPYCGAYKPEELSSEETTLIYTAMQKIRLANFDDAEEQFNDLVEKYNENHQVYWGLVLSKYGIKYEKDYDGKMIPSCYKASYESIKDDGNFKKAIKYADKDNKEYYVNQAERIEKTRLEWVEKASKEEPYDIFISYKDSDKENNIDRTEDSRDAFEIYAHLIKKGYRVFYSRETLKGKTGESYEPYIFNALNTSKIMIVFGSTPDYITSTWVKNEWLRFLKKIRNNEKEQNALICVYNKFSPSELPSALSKVQGLDFNSRSFYLDLDAYCEKVYKASTSKLNTITRTEIKKKKTKEKTEISKFNVTNIKKEEKKENIKRNVVEQRQLGQTESVKVTIDEERQLNLINNFLQRKNFSMAKKELDLVLQKNQTNGLANLYKLFIDYKCSNLDELLNSIKEITDFTTLENVLIYADSSISDEIIKKLSELILVAINNREFTKAQNIYSQIYKYDNKYVTGLRENVFEECSKLVATNYKEVKIFIDSCLEYEKDGEIYLVKLKKITNTLIDNKNFDEAKEYLKLWLEVEDFSFGVNIAKLEIEKKCNKDQLFNSIYNNKDTKTINELIEQFDNKGLQRFITEVLGIILTNIENQNYDVAKFWAENILVINFEDRDKMLDKMLDDIISKISIKSGAFFEYIISISNLTKLKTSEYFTKFANALKKNKEFNEAIKYYNKAIEYDDNIGAYLGILEANLQVTSKEDYVKNIVILEDFSLVENVLSILETKDQIEFLDRLISYSTEYMKNSNDTKILKVFKKLLSYYPKEADEKVSKYLLSAGEQALESSNYEMAKELLLTALTYNQNDNKIHWLLLLAKSKCKTDDELIKIKEDIEQLEDYQNAIRCTIENWQLNYYLDIPEKQKKYKAEQLKLKKAKKKKRNIFISALSILVILVLAAGITSISIVSTINKSLRFENNTDGVSIYAGKNFVSEDILVIPSTYKGKNVTEIQDGAFKDHTEIKKLILPNTITTIGDEAFSGCTNLMEVVIESSTNQQTNINTTKINKASNNEKTNLKTIGNRAFYGCNQLSVFELKSGILTIGNEAFSNTGFYNITLPNTLKTIGINVFNGCKNLEEIKYDGTQQEWTNVNKTSLKNNGLDIEIIFSQYTITYNLNGGENSPNNPSKYTIEDSITLSEPTKIKEVKNSNVVYVGGGVYNKTLEATYYVFDGWYKESTFINKITTISNETENIEVYAKWSEETYDKSSSNANMQYLKEDNYIYFGTYPQTKVTDESLISTLKSNTGSLPTSDNSQNWTSYKYYINGSNSTDYMWYIDTEYNNDKYRGVYFTQYRPYFTTYSSSTSNSYQGDNGYKKSIVYWFKYEPIKWRILTENNGEALILSELILDSQDYNPTYNNNYANSAIRKWLNETFYNTAFSELQKELIQITSVDNSARSTNPNNDAEAFNDGENQYACDNTQDKIFLLSMQEVTNTQYGFNENYSNYDTIRQKKTSDYAQSQGAYTNNGGGRWWLRSPYYGDSNDAWLVNRAGSVSSLSVCNTRNGVAGALKIKLLAE